MKILRIHRKFEQNDKLIIHATLPEKTVLRENVEKSQFRGEHAYASFAKDDSTLVKSTEIERSFGLRERASSLFNMSISIKPLGIFPSSS